MIERKVLLEIYSKITTSPTELGRLLGVSKQRADQLLHPEKERARRLVRKNQKKPKACQVCGKICEDLEGHHYDYSKPDCVIWTCTKCHAILKIREVDREIK